MSEKLYVTNDGHLHENEFESVLESLRPLLSKFLQSTVQRILYKDLGLEPYKITIVQQLNERDSQQRLPFCQIMSLIFIKSAFEFVFVKMAIICLI